MLSLSDFDAGGYYSAVNGRSDSELLRDYAERRSDAAFAELVRRHIDLVYSAARRMVCDPHLAEDVTQSVFVALAQNAQHLVERTVLSGWLHRTARNIAAQTVRTDVRRRAREQEAAAMNELLAPEPDFAWEQVSPHLDAALASLSEADSDALMLRYFERRSAREMAQTLGTSEEAAQKRVNRAVERLREFFARRGVTVGTSGLAMALTANSVQAAPVGLSITVITGTTALAGTAFATKSTLLKGILLMASTKQKAAVAAIALFLILVATAPLILNRPTRPSLTGNSTSNLPNAELEFRWVADGADAASAVDLLPDETDRTNQQQIRVLKEIVLDRGNIESASLGRDERETKQIVVLLDEEGRRTFAAATAKNIGRRLAIVWKGRVVSAPVVRSAIRDRHLKVSGSFSDTEAQELLAALNHR